MQLRVAGPPGSESLLELAVVPGSFSLDQLVLHYSSTFCIVQIQVQLLHYLKEAASSAEKPFLFAYSLVRLSVVWITWTLPVTIYSNSTLLRITFER